MLNVSEEVPDVSIEMGDAGEPGRAEAPCTSGVADDSYHDPAIVPVHTTKESARDAIAEAAVDACGADD